jgi:hypothetical protein
LGFGDLEINDRESAEETPLEQTQRLVVACGGPYLTVNEARQSAGLDSTSEGDEVRISSSGNPGLGTPPNSKV